MKYLSLLISLFFVINVTSAEDQIIHDPWEGYNRAIFSFNERLDKHLLQHVSDGYGFITPSLFREGVTNFFENLSYPKFLVSDLVQLKFLQSLEHTGRFLINSTIGVAGIFDVAQYVGLPEHYEDFGLALAHHNVGPGPYWVIPFLGPSNLRDVMGRTVDTFLNPLYYLSSFNEIDDDDALLIGFGATALELINQRYSLDEAIKSGKDSSLDYYLFVQSSYYQYREGLLSDGASPDLEDDWDNDWDDDGFEE